jgi:hypothetical protein
MLAAASRWGSRVHLDHADDPTAAAAAEVAGSAGPVALPLPATFQSSRRSGLNPGAAPGGAGDDPIDVCSSSDGEATPTQRARGGRVGARGGAGAGRFGAAARQQQQQQQDVRGGSKDQEGPGFSGGGAGGLPSGRSGFTSARTQLVSDLQRKGQHQQASMFQASGGCGDNQPCQGWRDS